MKIEKNHINMNTYSVMVYGIRLKECFDADEECFDAQEVRLPFREDASTSRIFLATIPSFHLAVDILNMLMNVEVS